MSLSLTRAIVEQCPTQLTARHRQQFSELGYIALAGVLSESEVVAARQALTELTHRLMQAARRGEGEVKQARPGATLNYAGPQVVTQGGGCAIHFEAGIDPLELSDDEAEDRFRKIHGYQDGHPTFQQLVAHPRIQGFIGDLIGQQMLLKDVMALSKPPFIGSEKPWHHQMSRFAVAGRKRSLSSWDPNWAMTGPTMLALKASGSGTLASRISSDQIWC